MCDEFVVNESPEEVEEIMPEQEIEEDESDVEDVEIDFFDRDLVEED